MARLDVNFDPRQLARRLSRSLDDVVASLIGADDAKAFVAALEMNGTVWREIETYSAAMGWRVPKKTVDFALAASARARRGVDDSDVEALITINMRVAGKIDQACTPGGDLDIHIDAPP